ncbi:MAG TPA: UvrD-helicase domain-containing protein [Chitinivibrionales bacterium]|nr:UvrD-helicase domain-containing protein [Chitinivibrionales bacterium]
MFRDIDLDKHGLVEASAGTGKTYTIERLVLRLLAEKNVLLENILVVTFTEAAAMELRSRMRALLGQACAGRGVDGFYISAKQMAWLSGELLAFDRANIFTIHGFCNRVLSRWPLETGLARGGEIVDEQSLANALVAEEMRGVWPEWDGRLEGALTKEIGEAGIEKFRAAVVAVAQRYAPGQVELAPEPCESLDAFCASEKAFDERVDGATGRLRKAAALLLEEYKRVKPLLRPAPLKDGKYDAITAWLNGFSCSETGVEEPVAEREETKETAGQWFGFTAPDMRVPEVAAFFGRWTAFVREKTGLCAEISSRSNSLVASLGLSLRHRLDRHRIGKGLTSYNDMIRSVEAALSRGTGALRDRLWRQYRYAIIDEFQDTNALQWNIFRSVFMEGGEKRLFVVGDPKQSIFRVQDADVYTYLEARGYYEEQCNKGLAKIYSLDVNHRSTKGLIDACNCYFSKNDWFAVAGIGFSPTGPADEKKSSANHADAGKKDEPDLTAMIGTLKPSGPVVVRPLYGLPDLMTGTRGCPRIGSQRMSYARYIVSKIIEWHQQGLPYRSMALLYETRTYAGPLLPLLREAGIPYSQYKEAGLFASLEALNWACLLEYLAEGAPQNLKRLLLTDFFGQDPSEVVAGRAVAQFGTVAAWWRTLAGRGQWPALMAAVFSGTALLCRAARRAGGKRVIAAYRQIGEWVAARLIADRMPPRDVAKLLRAYYAGTRPPPEEEDRFRRETEEDAVAATTIHSSKGLQFDVVFVLAGAGRARSPDAPYVVRAENGMRRGKILVSLDKSHKAAMAREEDGERRRLLYVGLTRARYKMVLPSWEEPKKDRKTGALLYDKLPHYEKNLLDASAENEKLFYRDLSAVSTAEPGRKRQTGYQRPRAGAFTSADSTPVESAARKIGAYAARCGISGRRQLLHSYTSLVHGGRDSGPEWRDEAHDNADEIAANLPEQLRFDPAAVLFGGSPEKDPQPSTLSGKKTGTALHEVLEGLDFTSVKTGNSVLNKKIENRFGAYGLLAGSVERRAETCRQVAGLLTAALSLKLPLVNGMTVSPAEIAPGDILSESYFSAAVGRRSGRIAEPAAGAGTSDSIIGFIDVIFRKGKDLYLLDWKSDTLDAYDKKSLGDAMEKRGYTVQAALYTAAFQRWLAGRFGAQGYALKGICYVFLRGPAAVTVPVDGEVLGKWEEGLKSCFLQAFQEKIMTKGNT